MEYENLKNITIFFSGNVIPSGISLRYKDSCGEMQSMEMQAPESSLRHQTLLWIAAMQKVRSTSEHLAILFCWFLTLPARTTKTHPKP